MNKNIQEPKPNFPQPYGYRGGYQQEDEIDFLAVFSALFAQWRILLGIMLAGTLIAVIIAWALPKAYEIDARLAQPTKVDIQSINVRGYDKFSQQELFNKFYDQLKSADHFREFLEKKGWLKRLYLVTDGWLSSLFSDTSASADEQFAEVYENFSTEVLTPKKKKGDENDLPPTLLGINLTVQDEALGVNLLNEYIAFTNQYVKDFIITEGRALRDLEKESIESKIAFLRKKAGMERATQLVKLSEAYNIAEAMGIRKPTTIEAMAQQEGKAQTMVSVGASDKNVLALMGTEYLQHEIEGLHNRSSAISFIEQIPELKKQFLAQKTEAEIDAFKNLVADDAYIEELPGLMSRLAELKQLTFDFDTAQTFRFDKTAMMDGKADSPNKVLIIVLGFVVSTMAAVFYVLIMNAYRKRSTAS